MFNYQGNLKWCWIYVPISAKLWLWSLMGLPECLTLQSIPQLQNERALSTIMLLDCPLLCYQVQKLYSVSVPIQIRILWKAWVLSRILWEKGWSGFFNLDHGHVGSWLRLLMGNISTKVILGMSVYCLIVKTKLCFYFTIAYRKLVWQLLPILNWIFRYWLHINIS